MESRLLILAIPSAIILVGLIWHSLRALPRWRALAFWVSVIAYGFVRGLAVQGITSTIGASFPYEIHNPMLSIFGVSAQELVGWAVVVYLGWWLGARFTRHLFLQVLWASLFLGAISWVVEAAAIAARWWHWTVPTASRVFMNVPAIGIVDWFFVGIDFLLPFAVLTSGERASRPQRSGVSPDRGVGRRARRPATAAGTPALLFFPIHFGAHLLPGIWPHVVHWALVLLVVWLALRSDVEDRPFSSDVKWIPHVAFAVIIIDAIIVELFIVERPELLRSVIPALLIWATPRLNLPRRRMAIPAMVLIAAFAVLLHWTNARARADMTRRLDAAIAVRDRGNLRDAMGALDAIARDHPTNHVALVLAGEIAYRTNQLDAAHARFARAVEIKQDFVRGYRFLAVIDLQRRNLNEAEKWARLGLEIAPGDLQLRYLAVYAAGEPVEPILAGLDANAARGMAALAFEVGDRATVNRLRR
jgi:hypothetical protein